ncbi:MAG: HAD-IG family 5'-nucleotidase [Myxococcales bacterium]|jgi:5'-nucleotidase
MSWLDVLQEGPPKSRDVFCNRTLNMRSLRAIGYDMDYTLVHYRVEEWERRAYEHIKQGLLADGWPIEHLTFDPNLVARGLVIDTEQGNLVKANRFGYVKRAFHGTRPLDFDAQRKVYTRVTVELAEKRWTFLNTLFSLSEACMYMQLVDLLDEGKLSGVMGYQGLLRRVHQVLDAAHMEGELKAEIMADPDRFVSPDPETPLTLMDQRAAGKKLMLITNSEWEYTRFMMSYAFDRYLPEGKTWRDLFDVVIIGARKPDFFLSRGPLFEVVNEEGLLRPAIHGITEGGIFLGGSASQVEIHLGLSGEEILYVGDHMWGDVHVSKSALRWRTALILRELEDEIRAVEDFALQQKRLDALMAEKQKLEHLYCQLRLQLQRKRAGYGPRPIASGGELDRELESVRNRLTALDEVISPLAQAAGEVGHKIWGQLMRAGNDKSHLARQVENYADIYTSRVSNLLYRTPYAYLRSMKGSLPHDVPGSLSRASE